MKKVFVSIFIFVGTAMGLGIFALPFAFLYSGIKAGILIFLGGALIVYLITACYAEIIMLNRGKKILLTDLAEKTFGPRFKHISTLSLSLGVWGSTFASLIAIQVFIQNIVGPQAHAISSLLTLLILIIVAILTYKGLRLIVNGETFLTIIKIIGVLIIAFLASRYLTLGNLNITVPIQWSNYFIFYGVIVFAFAGWAALPFMYKILAYEKTSDQQRAKTNRDFHGALIGGFILLIILYFFFTISVMLASGSMTSPESFVGLAQVLGQPMIIFGSIIGIINIFTTIVVLNLYLKDVYRDDYGLSNLASVFIVFLPPVMFFLAGVNNFTEAISFLGTVTFAFDGIIILSAWKVLRDIDHEFMQFRIGLPTWSVYVIGGILTVGALFEIGHIFFAF